jgi:hypothetical protein
MTTNMPNKFPVIRIPPGRWIAVRIGLFALGAVPVWEFGYADAARFRVTAN